MVHRHRKGWGVLAVVLAGPLVTGCAKAAATPPGGPGFVLTLAVAAVAPGDTARYVLTIVPPTVTASSPAVLSWNVRVLGTDTTKDTLATQDYVRALLYHNFTGRLTDTVALAAPLTFTDSTGPYRVAARGANQFGNGAWVKSPPWYLKRRGLPPGPPGVLIDSTTLNKLSIAHVDIRPQVVTLAGPGAGIQLCAFATMQDSSKGMFEFSRALGRVDSVKTDTIAACQARFAAYLAERPV